MVVLVQSVKVFSSFALSMLWVVIAFRIAIQRAGKESVWDWNEESYSAKEDNKSILVCVKKSFVNVTIPGLKVLHFCLSGENVVHPKQAFQHKMGLSVSIR